ncbi:MAG TPA: secondary thiamine-phosphate synthase enzyme YjbQ [Candidatus Acidoferrales bacterium]
MMKPAGQHAKQPARGLTRVLEVKTARRTELVEITREVEKLVVESGCQSGVCHLHVPHTTAGITINENDDPDVPRDIEAALDRLVPKDGPYKHWEGNADSHIKSTIVGCTQSVPIEGGRLVLGKWQAIFFCEFDGPRDRQVNVKIIRA